MSHRFTPQELREMADAFVPHGEYPSIEHALRQAAEDAEFRKQLETPEWGCLRCGHVGRDFKERRYSAGDADVECPKCGSVNVDENGPFTVRSLLNEARAIARRWHEVSGDVAGMGMQTLRPEPLTQHDADAAIIAEWPKE